MVVSVALWSGQAGRPVLYHCHGESHSVSSVVQGANITHIEGRPLPRVDINAQMFTVNLCKRFVLHAEIWFEEWFRFSFHTAVTLSWRTLSPAASWSVFAQRHYNGVVTWCEWWPLRTSLKKDQVKINNIFNEFVCSCSGIELEKLRTFVINLKKHVRI